MTRILRVAEHHDLCATRERGRSFATVVRREIEALSATDDLVLDFAEVEFVSPSFLDESVVRFWEDEPTLVARVRPTGLQPLAAAHIDAVRSAREVTT